MTNRDKLYWAWLNQENWKDTSGQSFPGSHAAWNAGYDAGQTSPEVMAMREQIKQLKEDLAAARDALIEANQTIDRWEGTSDERGE